MSNKVMLFLGLAQAFPPKFTKKEIQLALLSLHRGSWNFRDSPNLMQPAGRLEFSMELRRPQIPLLFLNRPCYACDFIFVLKLLSGTSGHSGFS